MPLLEVDRLYARYDYAPVVHGVSFSVDAGEIVSIFGRNGAGKTTTLRTIMGWLRPSQGRIVFEGEAIEGMSPDRVFRKGIAFIPEDRRIFATLSVEENLILGLFSRWQSGVEPSEGLAPMVVNEIFESLARMRSEGVALLLVEQNVRRAAAVSSSCYVMEKGRIIKHGAPADVMIDEAIRQRLSV